MLSSIGLQITIPNKLRLLIRTWILHSLMSRLWGELCLCIWFIRGYSFQKRYARLLISNRSLFGMVICSPILDNISRPYRTYLSIDVCVNLYFVHMSFQYEWQSIPKKKIISSQESNQLTLCKAKSMHKNCKKPLFSSNYKCCHPFAN
jgi:hypothetical protein